MSTRKRVEELEAAAMRQGYDEFNRRLSERVARLSSAELTALRVQLEHYLRTGESTPGLIETIKEMTTP